MQSPGITLASQTRDFPVLKTHLNLRLLVSFLKTSSLTVLFDRCKPFEANFGMRPSGRESETCLLECEFYLLQASEAPGLGWRQHIAHKSPLFMHAPALIRTTNGRQKEAHWLLRLGSTLCGEHFTGQEPLVFSGL